MKLDLGDINQTNGIEPKLLTDRVHWYLLGNQCLARTQTWMTLRAQLLEPDQARMRNAQLRERGHQRCLFWAGQ